MIDYSKRYYNQKMLWNHNRLDAPAQKERIRGSIGLIPADVESLLDVGCGKGDFVNTLVADSPGRFKKIVGLDISKEALKYVRADKIEGTIADLPFADKSFDLLTCLETLEHLPHEDLKKGAAELQRVSRKYILVTVPNVEDIENSLVMCPKCHCWFNPNYHFWSFNQDKLRDLFDDFNPLQIEEIGITYRYRAYNRNLLRFYRFWIRPPPPASALCPQCGYQPEETPPCPPPETRSSVPESRSSSPSRQLVKSLIPLREKKAWLAALYQRKNG